MQNVCDMVLWASHLLYTNLAQTMFVSPLTQSTMTSVSLFSLTHLLSFLQSYSFICLLYIPNKHLQPGAPDMLCPIKGK